MRIRSARRSRQNERDLIIDDIGLPQRPINLAFTDGSAIGVNDGVIQIALKPGHAPTADYVKRLREESADAPSRMCASISSRQIW